MAPQTLNIKSVLAIPNPGIGKMHEPQENLMARGIDALPMTVIDGIIVHDGTATATTEAGMTSGKEMIGETGLGETAAGIAIVGMRIAEGVLHMLTSDGTPPSLPVVRPMVLHVPAGRLIPTGKRASEYHSPQHDYRGFDTHTHRISPHPLRGSSPSPRKTLTIIGSNPPASARSPDSALPTQSEPELELATSPVPTEVSLAARRAKRQAILAKYAGVASVNTTEASPSPGPSSAVQPPPPSAEVSDPQSQRHSIVGENGAASVSRDPSAGPSREFSRALFSGIYPEICDTRTPRVPIRIACN